MSRAGCLIRSQRARAAQRVPTQVGQAAHSIHSGERRVRRRNSAIARHPLKDHRLRLWAGAAPAEIAAVLRQEGSFVAAGVGFEAVDVCLCALFYCVSEEGEGRCRGELKSEKSE